MDENQKFQEEQVVAKQPEAPEIPVQEVKSVGVGDENLMAALSYLWILSVVILLVRKDSDYIKFHAKQGLILFLASVILWFVPVLGWMFQLVIATGMVVGFVKALTGERFSLPLVADLAKKINL